MSRYYRDILETKYEKQLEINYELKRSLVSFQANKKLPIYKWFKYKEGFSVPMIEMFLEDSFKTKKGKFLDPFSGSGTSLFAMRDMGWDVSGIELLPVGLNIIKSRIDIEKINISEVKKMANKIIDIDFLKLYNLDNQIIKHIPITEGAFPEKTSIEINNFIKYCNTEIKESNIKQFFLFAIFCILEDISYTRKDGQYLRWDNRAEKLRSKPTKFRKAEIFDFKIALQKKIEEMILDLETVSLEKLEDTIIKKGNFDLIEGSLLEVLPKIKKSSIDLIITSPPYCNRYDYTRTYALELVFLGSTDKNVKDYRQTQLSCTVENKSKKHQLKQMYLNLNKGKEFEKIEETFSSEKALFEVIEILEKLKQEKKLNNPNITTMIENYFFEMCVVIFELFRIMKKEGRIYMVNDNVQYGGEDIPVDLILSNYAEKAGFTIKKIWVLPTGKGNSSQQMDTHGRNELRKCVYIWEK